MATRQPLYGKCQKYAQKMNKTLETKLETIPDSSGVYQFKNKDNKIIYIGKAKNLKNRVKSYFIEEHQSIKTSVLKKKIADVDFFLTASDKEALILENNLIKQHQPRYNIRLKDDKTYPYIKITHEPFPQVYMTRKIVNDGSKYIGPYTSVHDVRSALRKINKLFQVRTCRFYMDEKTVSAKKHKVCLDYHIERCGGPCEAKQSINEYSQIIGHVEKFLLGKSTDLRRSIKQEMQEYSKHLEFEKAAKKRDSLEALNLFIDHLQYVEKVNDLSQDYLNIALEDDEACIVIIKVRDGKVNGKQQFLVKNEGFLDKEHIFEGFLSRIYSEFKQIPNELYIPDELSSNLHLHKEFLQELTKSNIKLYLAQRGEKLKLLNIARINASQKLKEEKLKQHKKDFVPKALKSLKRDLNLDKEPLHIECFDNSNFQGTDAVSSLVVFKNAKPAKSEYRRFKVKSLTDGQADDFKSMYEVVYRRYKRLLDEKLQLPDLIMVDGGKGQLSAAVKALQSIGLWPHPIIGLAKRLEEVFIPSSKDPQTIPRTSSSIKLLQQLRDEAHRFAITFHRERRKKRTLQSELDDIPGIGEKRKKMLLNKFGSLKKIKEASQEDLKTLQNFPDNLVKLIYNKFK
jgi:excinuclease ABC subunit C